MTKRENNVIFRPTTLLAALALAVGALLHVPAGNVVLAQDGEAQEEETKTRRAEAIRPKIYEKFVKVQELSEAKNYTGALAVLDEVKAMPKLSSYEQQNLYQQYGYLYYELERYNDAVRSFEKVLEQPDINPRIRDTTRFTVAQLYYTAERYQDCINMLNQWLQDANNPGPDVYMLLGTAYYQLEKYRDMVPAIERSIAIARERGTAVKENQYLLLRVAYFELNNYPKMRDVLEILVRNWPKKEYWTQLSAVYGELKDEKKQLASYAAAYEQNLFNKSSEIVQLAQLYLAANVPWKAAKVMQKGIDDGIVDKDAKNYRLLAQAYQLAQEDEKAIAPLKAAAQLSSDGELDVRLGRSYLNLDRFGECVSAVRSGLNKGGVKRPDEANLILGTCLYEQDKYDEAKSAFRLAANDKRSAKNANQWISFISNEQKRLRQLEESMRQVRRVAQEREEAAAAEAAAE